jgi:hypothetical protein
VSYVTVQAVLQEAGLWQRELAEVATGLLNGSNCVFTVDHKPLADNNYDDVLDGDDVEAYVDGSPVTVSAVDEDRGQVTLVAAPAGTATEVTVDYSFSAIPLAYVAQVIEEAEELIDDEMGQVVTTPYETVPKTVRRIARVYAAGLLMSREYGLQAMTDESGKEGDRKIKLAEAWLSAYRTRMESNGADAGTLVVPRSSSQGRVFQTYDTADGTWGPLSDENFSINEAS